MSTEDVEAIARKVNSCTDIAADIPIQVWLDRNGWYVVEVKPLGHYVTCHPSTLDDDDEAVADWFADSCACSDCTAAAIVSADREVPDQ